MLPLEYRLREARDFRRVYRQGAYVVAKQMVLYYYPSEHDSIRVGFVASKKVGKSVQRNRCKRVLREVFGHYLSEIAPGYDFVVVARPPMKEETFAGAHKTMARLLRKAKLLRD